MPTTSITHQNQNFFGPLTLHAIPTKPLILHPATLIHSNPTPVTVPVTAATTATVAVRDSKRREPNRDLLAVKPNRSIKLAQNIPDPNSRRPQLQRNAAFRSRPATEAQETGLHSGVGAEMIEGEAIDVGRQIEKHTGFLPNTVIHCGFKL